MTWMQLAAMGAILMAASFLTTYLIAQHARRKGEREHQARMEQMYAEHRERMRA